MNVGAEEESNNKIVSFVTKWSGSISHLFAAQKVWVDRLAHNQ